METFEKVAPIGRRKTFAHLNYGEFDKRNGFQEVEMDEYPAEAVASGREMREARLAADLGLRQASKLLAFTATQLSGVEQGSLRFIEAEDRASVLAFYASHPKLAPSPSEKPVSERDNQELLGKKGGEP